MRDMTGASASALSPGAGWPAAEAACRLPGGILEGNYFSPGGPFEKKPGWVWSPSRPFAAGITRILGGLRFIFSRGCGLVLGRFGRFRGLKSPN